MKKILLSLTLISVFASCKKQADDPAREMEDNTVRLSKITYTYSKDGSVPTKRSYEIVYDKTGSKIEKINGKFAPLNTFDHPESGDYATISFESDVRNIIKSALITPKVISSSNQPGKYSFSYTGDKFTSFFKDSDEAVTLEFDANGNVVKTTSQKTGDENTFSYANNVLSFARMSSGANYDFQFSNLINPLASMDKGAAHLLINDFYALGGTDKYRVPFYFQARLLSSYSFRAQPGSPQPVTTTYTLKESKQNYPLKIEVMNDHPSSRILNEKITLEYEYVNL